MTHRTTRFLLAIAMFAISVPALGLSVVPPAGFQGTPIELGAKDLDAALAGIAQPPEHLMISVGVPGADTPATKAALAVLPDKPESFAIARAGNYVAIAGSDDVGAMYGCFDLAERLDMNGRMALDIREPIVQSPVVEFRAVNPFLTLPYKISEDEWWFLQDDYWEGYLNQLARARINWVDLHGMYDIKTTGFPNLYPYFITSDQFPGSGAETEKAARNLAMLNKVIKMAKQRGIKFALMSYSASWYGPGLRGSPHEDTEENMAAYTREVVRKTIESCPDLAMIGFRIGESGKSADFFRKSYIPAIAEAKREIDLYTRTWVSRKDQILPIGQEFPGRFFAEIKYNGEQYGPPYIIAGGRMQYWHSYSYQDYYTYPRSYKIIYQLRANGTHRVFPWGNPELAARSNQCSTLGGALGLCVEPINAYYPKYDFRHRDDSPNRWFTWQYERDWFWYEVWGRTAYDPSLKFRDDIWTRMFERHFGKAAAFDMFNAMKWASKIVPDAYTSHALGPDHRNHAPELEWGGTLQQWADGQPFDCQNIQSPREFADRLVRNDPSAKTSPLVMARYLEEEADATLRYVEAARSKVAEPTAEFNDLTTGMEALAYLGYYYSHKLRAATFLAVLQAANDPVGGVYAGPDGIREELRLARASWDKLAEVAEANFKPFVDTLRLHTEEYTWTQEGKYLDEDIEALDKALKALEESSYKGKAPWIWSRGDGSGPTITKANSKVVDIRDGKMKKLTVNAVVEDPSGVGSVQLKTKPFPSERFWTTSPMTKKGDVYVGEVLISPEGLMWCIEAVDADGNGAMWPNFREETPYRVVLPWDSPLTQTSAMMGLEAIDQVDPSRADYSMMIAGRNAFTLNKASDSVKQSIMARVQDGLSLVVMCQDAPQRWDGDWLGGGIKFTDADYNYLKLVGDHPIFEGIPDTIEIGRIINDGLEGGEPEWTHLTDPKGLAVRKYGKGYIVLTQMDIQRSMNMPVVSNLFNNVLKFAKQGSDKPVLVLDPGGRAVYSILNLYGQDFKTLGELVAEMEMDG